MNAIDTNVFIYGLDTHFPVKRAKARQLLRQLYKDPEPTVLLWQVIGELTRHLRSWQDKGRITRARLLRYVSMARRFFPLIMPTPAVLDRALDLASRFSLSHWDSMLLGACKEAGVNILYTEDIGSPVIIDGIKLINPFI